MLWHTVHRRYLASGNISTTALVLANNHINPFQATGAEPLEEIDPADLVLFHTLSCTKNFTVAILIHRNSYPNSYIFKLFTQVAARVDTIHVDIQKPSTLQRKISPFLNGGIRLLVQLTYGGEVTPYCPTESLLYSLYIYTSDEIRLPDTSR